MAKDRVRDQAVGKVLRRLRESKGAGQPLTQREVARGIGLVGPGGTVSISRFESGTVHVPPERLAALAEVLGTTADQINEEASALAVETTATGSDEAAQTSGLAATVRTAFGSTPAHENHLRRTALEREVADRRERTVVLLERLHDAQQELVDGVFKPYVECSGTLNLPVPEAAVPAPDAEQSPANVDRYAATKDLLGRQIRGSLGRADLGAAAPDGAGAAAAVFAWVAASTAASTAATTKAAAALGAHGGAAASGATLAWLGGGPLAAGELGLAGGTLVLGSIAMLPALIAAGGVMAYHSHRQQQHDAEESERLDLAERELARTGEQLETTWQTIIRARSVTDAYTTVGLREIRWLRSEAASGTPSPMARSDVDRARFESLTDLVVSATVVLGLPILRDLQPDAMDDPEREERAQWIAFVLDHASAQVDAYVVRPYS